MSTNMSISIGGRIVTPALPVVDPAPPTSLELSLDSRLRLYAYGSSTTANATTTDASADDSSNFDSVNGKDGGNSSGGNSGSGNNNSSNNNETDNTSSSSTSSTTPTPKLPNIPVESKEGIRRREMVLDRLSTLCREWIRASCIRASLPPDAVDAAGGEIYTSGSYRLGVHEPGADIDAVVVAPNVCTRSDFFGVPYDGGSDSSSSGSEDEDEDDEEDDNKNKTVDNETKEDGKTTTKKKKKRDSGPKRDPRSLAEMIRRRDDVTNFVPVENAMVPILTFDWDGVNVDLLLATLNVSSVPRDLDIDDDAVLDGVDPATEKSLNGPRVTNLIAALVGGSTERYETFLTVVRCARKWARNRGLYSNKMGYWGGVNINISVALVIQLYPNACAVSLLRKFFLVFKSWRWPNPVVLTRPHDAGLGLVVWNAGHARNQRQVAPIVTPACKFI